MTLGSEAPVDLAAQGRHNSQWRTSWAVAGAMGISRFRDSIGLDGLRTVLPRRFPRSTPLRGQFHDSATNQPSGMRELHGVACGQNAWPFPQCNTVKSSSVTFNRRARIEIVAQIRRV